MSRRATPSGRSLAATTPGRGRARTVTLLLVALAVLLRLLHDADMARTPFFRFPGLDASWHDEWAREILAGRAPGDPFFRAPGYAYFLALVYRIAGSGPWPAHVAQALLGGLTVWLVYRITRRLYGRPAGNVAAGIAAFYGPLVYFDGEFLAPTLALPVFLAALHLSLRADICADPGRAGRGGSGWFKWLVAGLAYGLGAVILPNILAVVALLAVVRLVRAARDRQWGAFRQSIVPLLAGTAILVLAVVIRNGVVGGDWGVLASQGGVNFYAGNNEKATGVSVVLPQFARQPGWREFISRTSEWAMQQAGHPLKPSEVSGFYTRKGLEFWARSPGKALGLLGARIYYLLNGHEIPNNRDLYSDRRFSRPLAALLWHAGPFHFPLGLILPLAALGLFLPRPRGAALLLLYLGAYAASVVLFFVTERYRLPLVPVLIVFAAAAIVNLVKGRVRPSPVALALAAVIAVLANSHWGRAGRSNPAQETVRLASAWFEAGDYRRSAATFEAAARQDPRSPDPLDGLGSALLKAGEKANARRAYDEAARRGSLDPNTWYNRGALQLEAGRAAEAVTSLERAVALDPGYVNAWVNLGLARSTLGQGRPALEALDKALALAPGNALALQEKGRLLASAGDRPGARRAFEAALAVSPAAPEVRLNLALLDYEDGRLDEAARSLAALLTSAGPELKPLLHFHLARIAARRGEKALLIDELEEARGAGFPVARAFADPVFDPWRADRDVLGALR